MFSQGKFGKNKAKIVQYADDKKTLPDGSKIVYAESDDKLVLYHKSSFEKSMSYVFNRKTTDVYVNGKRGNDRDKQKMLQLGSYFISNAEDNELVTIDVKLKGEK